MTIRKILLYAMAMAVMITLSGGPVMAEVATHNCSVVQVSVFYTALGDFTNGYYAFVVERVTEQDQQTFVVDRTSDNAAMLALFLTALSNSQLVDVTADWTDAYSLEGASAISN